jgi:hypothetical protein
MPVKSSGSLSIDELRTYFNEPGVTPGATPLSTFYKDGVPIPISPLNASVPSSGPISISNMYNSYKLAYGPSLQIDPGESSDTQAWIGYQESGALISDGAIGSASINFGSNPYTDGNGNSRRVNCLLYEKATSRLFLKTATSSTINNDAGVYRIFINGGGIDELGVLYTSSAAATGMQGTPGSAQYGRFWRWNVSNPFIIGFPTLLDVEYLK